MSCKCAKFDEDECRYYCDVSGSQCMYMSPNSERCAKEYGEGPDADSKEVELELEDFHEVEEDKEDVNMNQYDMTKVIENYYRASSALMEIGTTKNIPEELRQLSINASAATMKIINYINSHKE